MFYIVYPIIWLLMWLPLPVLYIFSDFFYLILYYLVGYRKKVVRQNLKNSFPDKYPCQLAKLERKFYRYFCDLFIETMYQLHMSPTEISRRMKFENIEAILKHYDEGKSVMLMTAHYGNWEWATSISLLFPPDKPVSSIYKQLRNKQFDQFIYRIREKYTGKNIEKGNLLRTIIKNRAEKKITTYGMISDQTPSAAKVRLWTPFLNQDTPTMLGTEELAKKFDYPVLYLKFSRPKRGYYHCQIIPISEAPRDTADGEITMKYLRLLEETISEAPEFWLWTHKRWKHKRPAAQNNDQATVLVH